MGIQPSVWVARPGVVVKLVVAAVLTAMIATACSATPSAQPAESSSALTTGAKPPCADANSTGLTSKAPGDLVDAAEITSTNDPNFPADARAWRVLYVSTGRDNSVRTLVCGVVVAPATSGKLFAKKVGGTITGRIANWDHGLLGITAGCQPSVTPEASIWGPTPLGINTVAWGSDVNKDTHSGTPQNGMLAGMIARGWVVTATDYYAELPGGAATLQPFMLGKIEAANSIDIVRAAHQLLSQQLAAYPSNAYDLVTWGHSQGGGAAMWTGQMTASYLKATAVPGAVPIALSGIALEAPGSTFITLPGQVGTGLEDGMIDWVMHEQVPMGGEQVPAVALVMPYWLATWNSYSRQAPAAAQMPAYPDTGPLEAGDMVTPDATATTVAQAPLCLNDADIAAVLKLGSPYTSKPFFLPEVSNGPVIAGFQHGNLGRTCASKPTNGIAEYCQWLRYNLPGQAGTSPFDKLPTRSGALVPILIANGNNDQIAYCVASNSAPKVVPSAKDCISTTLYDSIQSSYCPNGHAKGYLSRITWRPQTGVTTADHTDIAGLAAAASPTDLSFNGSPLQKFMDAAFDGTLKPGCSAVVVNK